jgi:hypothetical protein
MNRVMTSRVIAERAVQSAIKGVSEVIDGLVVDGW